MPNYAMLNPVGITKSTTELAKSDAYVKENSATLKSYAEKLLSDLSGEGVFVKNMYVRIDQMDTTAIDASKVKHPYVPSINVAAGASTLKITLDPDLSECKIKNMSAFIAEKNDKGINVKKTDDKGEVVKDNKGNAKVVGHGVKFSELQNNADVPQTIKKIASFVAKNYPEVAGKYLNDLAVKANQKFAKSDSKVTNKDGKVVNAITASYDDGNEKSYIDNAGNEQTATGFGKPNVTLFTHTEQRVLLYVSDEGKNVALFIDNDRKGKDGKPTRMYLDTPRKVAALIDEPVVQEVIAEFKGINIERVKEIVAAEKVTLKDNVTAEVVDETKEIANDDLDYSF